MVDEIPRCGAKTRQGGGPCQKYPVRGSKRCRLHGGASLVGTASGTYVHGRNSRHAPTRMEEDLTLARQDPELVSLQDEIVILSARESDLLKRADNGESGELWKELRRAWADFDRARHGGDAEAETYAVYEMGQLITAGVADHNVWNEFYQVVEKRKKLLEAERRREKEANLHVPVERVLELLTSIRGIVTRRVRDPHLRSAIFRDLQVLIGGGRMETFDDDDVVEAEAS